ncbi:MAG: magnesium transporter [Gallionellales bacterium 35-53-114]|jgi:magnesium transporter|nr:MAG: magnesium transporter [Gallionellales bacterium 35-53-114]OYZ63734.1 MAG: magnesium transporter [Gallionellales bacterium 24-53-125]OZB09434.1 MAG: magnesium transporter [Gallionellales bacterium 39-52-133]HQS57906.1 magnesium transporter [Gallionellaceae bacterium]HQS76067.1 magnesium transporter [Gallionellaceae bacterium]
MTEIHEPHHTENVQDHLQQVQHLLEKQALVETVAHQQEMPRAERHELVEKLLHKRHLTELRKKLADLHSADIAYILEALPIDQRLLVWDLVKADRDGEILIEVSDAVRESLIATMSGAELLEATEQLDTDEIADLAPDLPNAVMHEVFKSLSVEEREQLRSAMSYPEDAVGALMDFDMVTIREDVTLEVVSRYLRRFEELPDHTDQLFIVDRNDHFKGVLPLNRLLVNEPELEVASLMIAETIKLNPDDKADQAAQAFERYDLVSAPVVDENGKLVGRVTVNAVMDYIRAESESDVLNLAGLREEEDIFASVWKSAKNRWLWLALNLCTAFFASRVIGLFEGTIEKFVALAALMPIVAGIAGNSANQTSTIIIRSLALGQITPANARRMINKELAIGAMNGLVWGGVAGMFAYLLYQNVMIGLIMTSAMLLNLLLGALAGLLIPLSMQRMGRDPAIGSSVLLTAITDSGGFFIFLGLATIFLMN